MAGVNYSILFSAVVSGTAGSGSPGDVLIPDAVTGLMVKATAANRGTRRSTGVALSNYVAGGVVDVQQTGLVSATLSGLAAGTAGWVRVSSTGNLERASMSGSDDVVGWVETDGTFHASFGFLTASLVNGGSISVTGTGFITATSGVQDAAALAFPLPAANGGTGLTSLGTNVSTLLGTNLASGFTTFAGTPSGANLASLLTSALPVSKGGTNRTALGGALQVLRTNAGATDTEWATVSGGGSSAGGSGQVQTSDGAGGFSAPTNVLAGANYLSIGTTPAASGAIRLGGSGAVNQIVWDSDTAGSDRVILATDTGGGTIVFGPAAADFLTVQAYTVSLSGFAGVSSFDARNSLTTDLACVAQKLNSNATTSSSSGTATNFTFAVNASEIWEIEFDGNVGCNNTGGVALGLDCPAGSTLDGTVGGAGSSTTACVAFSMLAINTGYGAMSTVAGPAERPATMRASVVVGGSAGSITLRLYSVTNTQTSTLYAGATFRARRAVGV